MIEKKDQTKYNLVVIDSSIMDRMHLLRLLSSFKRFKVDGYDSIRRGLHGLSEECPDLIITEWELGDNTAADLMQVLESRAEWKNIPVLICTSNRNKKIPILADQLHAVGVILKPPDKAILYDYLKQLFPPPPVESGMMLKEVSQDNYTTSGGLVDTIRQKLSWIDRLIPLPVIVQEIIEISNNPNSSAKDLAEVIRKDQSITAKILKIVNSAYYGFYRKVGGVSHAIVILGFNEIKNITLAACMIQAFSEEYNEIFNRNEFWVHSLGAAYTARALSAYTQNVKADNAFVIGLLHDIGKVILDQYFSRSYGIVLEEAMKKKESLHTLARNKLGIDHAEVGGIVTEKWKLPIPLVRAIQYHHTPMLVKSSEQEVHLAHLSNFFCHHKGIGSSGNYKPDSLNPKSLESIGLKDVEVDEIWDSLKVDAERLKSIYD